MMKKKILFISYAFPSLILPESIQVVRTIKFISLESWDPLVLTVNEKCTFERTDKDLLKQIPLTTEVIRTKSFEHKSIIKILWHIYPKLLYLPDSKIGWYRYAVKEAQSVLKEKNISLIHSWASPFTSHLVGLKLKKETDLPWIAHFSDPWVDNPYFPNYGGWHQRFNLRLEREVVENADAIIFVSERTKDMIAERYPYIKNKSFIVPHCYDEEVFASLKKWIKKDETRFTMTYTGNFYGPRSPMPLFSAVRNLMSKNPNFCSRLNIQIVGSMEQRYRMAIKEMGLEKVVSYQWVVPYLKSLEYMVKSDILLLIDAPSEKESLFFPSKLADYIGAEKPILGITPINGESADILRDLGYPVVDPKDIEGIEGAILKFYEKHRGGAPIFVSEKALKYKAENVVKELAGIFERYCK